jgi:hypothetical protein
MEERYASYRNITGQRRLDSSGSKQTASGLCSTQFVRMTKGMREVDVYTEFSNAECSTQWRWLPRNFHFIYISYGYATRHFVKYAIVFQH